MRINPLTRHMKNRVHEHGDEVTVIARVLNKWCLEHADGYQGWRTFNVDFEVVAPTRGDNP